MKDRDDCFLSMYRGKEDGGSSQSSPRTHTSSPTSCVIPCPLTMCCYSCSSLPCALDVCVLLVVASCPYRRATRCLPSARVFFRRLRGFPPPRALVGPTSFPPAKQYPSFVSRACVPPVAATSSASDRLVCVRVWCTMKDRDDCFLSMYRGKEDGGSSQSSPRTHTSSPTSCVIPCPLTMCCYSCSSLPCALDVCVLLVVASCPYRRATPCLPSARVFFFFLCVRLHIFFVGTWLWPFRFHTREYSCAMSRHHEPSRM